MGVSTVNVRSDSGFSNAQYTLYFVYLGLIVCFSSYAGEFLRFPVSISNIMLSFSLHHFGGGIIVIDWRLLQKRNFPSTISFCYSTSRGSSSLDP